MFCEAMLISSDYLFRGNEIEVILRQSFSFRWGTIGLGLRSKKKYPQIE